MQVHDKVVIVTGGSSGIGLATARLLADAGARVVIAARDDEDVELAAKQVPGSLGIPTDITREDDIKSLVETTIRGFGRIDILVNNAGQVMQGPVSECSMEDIRRHTEVNFFGQIMMLQAVVPAMKKQGAGAIVNVGSGTVKMVVPGAGIYSSLKAALHHLSMTAREELANDNIVVSIVHPGITATNLGRNRHATRSPESIQETQAAEMPPPPGPVDPPEKVAAVILQVIESGAAEACMIPEGDV